MLGYLLKKYCLAAGDLAQLMNDLPTGQHQSEDNGTQVSRRARKARQGPETQALRITTRQTYAMSYRPFQLISSCLARPMNDVEG